MTDIPTIREPEDDEADLTDLPDRPADQHGSDDDPDVDQDTPDTV